MLRVVEPSTAALAAARFNLAKGFRMAPVSSRSERQLRVRAAQIAYIDQVCAGLGLKPTQLARAAGIAPTTLTRFRNDEERGGTLALPSLSAVAAFSRMPVPPEAVGDVVEPDGLREPDAVPYKAKAGDPLAEIVQSYLGLRNGLYAMTARTRVLEYHGVRPGDVLIVDLNGEPVRGDVVVAQLYDWQTPNQTETVLRLFNPPVLMTAGPEAADDEPRLIEDRSVGIKGVMVARIGGRSGRLAA